MADGSLVAKYRTSSLSRCHCIPPVFALSLDGPHVEMGCFMEASWGKVSKIVEVRRVSKLSSEACEEGEF